MLDFIYKGEVEVGHAALAPLAVLAHRTGLNELVDCCVKAIISWCVSSYYFLFETMTPNLTTLKHAKL